ncbi:chemotaxis protein CheC [Natrarchaeobaculum sulfurireducens]|uniref:Chemotaxis protein CheC n=1 Tax=Natrarchaeobaculum sulfurireducens TaxID=2044521 RepID=A0A346PC08_9EURY|nr:chemotaxis protein CheC [Natrarchaeobaculum sulfurireducens]AXR77053.1 Chemotaxis protein CheC [Natrarchaeobaculum sulfurireducens]AXR82981.1 Chemotaxis protein CheC -- inhibitor of MCP methylation [Natrarchaeobaculum sulfurireducens]
MEIDIRSLETYNELARDGAESAAAALSELTGIEARVEVTDVSLRSQSDLRAAFGDRGFAGVSVSLGEPLSGETVLSFDDSGREAITNSLVPTDDPERARSAIVEVGNIMVNGFVGGWADHLDTKVELTPPTYVEGTGVDALPETATDGDGYVLVFRSRVQTVGDDVDFRLLLVPELESLERLVERRADSGISLEKLAVFSEMTERGATRAAENITTMTGLEAAVEVNRVTFTSITDIPVHVGDDQRVGTVVQYSGTPSGYLAVLFDPDSARASVAPLFSGSSERDWEWDEIERGALEELCNVVVSGFVDGWANVLQTSIKHSPPSFVTDMGSSIVSPIIADVGREENYAFLLDSTIETGDIDSVGCQLFALPRPAELERALDELLIERAEQTRADPRDVF